MTIPEHIIKDIEQNIEGEVINDKKHLLLYATDASAYREKPALITYPKNTKDIISLIKLANKHKLPLIPRTAGTSLAGQVVGDGIIADVSKHMTSIIEINKEEKWVDVEPGVILDELNMVLEEYGLFFGPETSTSSRCMIGGMLGNNSCGAHSLIYGSTREHTLQVEAVLSDGSQVLFKDLSDEEFKQKLKADSLEGDIYRNINEILSDEKNQKNIRKEYPHPDLERRNTGYAIDLLLESSPFTPNTQNFNFSKLLAGSEGTLAFSTKIRLNLVELPPKHKALVCVHLEDVPKALKANIIALKHKPASIELMDKPVMDLTKDNRKQDKNRFFVKGDPGAVLIVEFVADTDLELNDKAEKLEEDLKSKGYGYHFPLVKGADIKKVWTLRKAGLGLLSNMKGDAKPVAVIEDTAVSPDLLPDYIEEFDALLEKHKLNCVYYAHIATGELHLRPILNLKDPKDVELFHTIALETAKLVKKYKGSLSGEHGDGRLRGEFIPLMIGEENYKLIEGLKKVWDPLDIFNPGKIVNTPVMNESLRYKPGEKTKEIDTVFDYSKTDGYLRAIEKCNGSGDCRKTHLSGGTMCPSYMATRDERNSTRARANVLREYITNQLSWEESEEIKDILDLCLSCKACKSECPSNVDITKYKAEFMQKYYDKKGVPMRTKLIAYITDLNRLGMIFPSVFNWAVQNKFISGTAKKAIGFAPKRSIPTLYKFTLKTWLKRNPDNNDNSKKVFLFADEFTNYNDVEIGIKAVKLLNKLGYNVEIPKHVESGRTFFSKGLLRKAKIRANKNVELLKDIVSEKTPLIGIEPSAILSFRDEYPEIVDKELIESAKQLSDNSFMIDEFIASEFKNGNINADKFSEKEIKLKLHGHCQQKAVASTNPTLEMLSIPKNYSVTEIPSGCCGMAGSFGYEKEHYELSQKVGEMVLFPEVRNSEQDVIIVAPGTSCRHQIKDGTNKKAKHPVEVIFEALK